MNKKLLSILLVGTLSIIMTGTALASSGEDSREGGSSKHSSKSTSTYSTKSENHSNGSDRQVENGDGWQSHKQGVAGPAHDYNWSDGQHNQCGNSHSNFNDLHEAAWAAPYITKLQDRDVVNGYQDGSFKPNQKVSRAESIAMMARGQNVTANGATQSVYLDAPGWACGYINWAVEKQMLVPGEYSNKLQPDKPATRLWVAQMAVRALGLDAQATVAQDTYLPINDAAAVPDGMEGYVKIATEKGIFVGYPDCTFQPNKPITRAEMSIIMSRLDAAMNNETLGTVTTADATSVTVSVYGGANKTIAVSPGATVWLNSAPATMQDIQPGDVVEIGLGTDGKAVTIDISSNRPPSAPVPAQ